MAVDSERVSIIKHNKGLLPPLTLSAKVYFDDFGRRINDIITQIEMVFYTHEGGKPKSEWSEYSVQQFSVLRHTMLDLSDEVKGLCDNIEIAGEVPQKPVQQRGLFGKR